MEPNARRLTKKKATKKKRTKKKATKRRRIRRPRSKNERLIDVAAVADERVASLLSQHSDLSDMVDNFRIEIENVEDVGFILREIVELQEDGSVSQRGVPREKVLELLRLIINLDEEDNVVTDVDGNYVPLKHPRVPLSILQSKALFLFHDINSND